MPFSILGAKVPRHFRSRERKFQGTKVPPMELSLPGVKVRGNESSIISLSACLSVCLGRCLSAIVCICSNFSCVSLCLFPRSESTWERKFQLPRQTDRQTDIQYKSCKDTDDDGHGCCDFTNVIIHLHYLLYTSL